MEYRNKNWLYNEYIVLGKGTKQIAKYCQVSSSTIWRWLKKFEIPIRTWGNGLEHSEEIKQKIGDSKRGKLSWSWKGGPEERICPVCKSSFVVSRKELNRGSGQFCSRSCRAIYTVKNQKKNNTDIENMMKYWLDRQDLSYVEQYVIITDRIKTVVDFFLPLNICLFCDGDYWHNKDDVKRRDKRINKGLLELNYEVIRLWGSEIYNGIRPEIKHIRSEEFV